MSAQPKGFYCRIEADSVAPNGKRLTTFVAKYPRSVLAEFNTHKMLSKNSASSRAIPVPRMTQDLRDDPFIPEVVYKNKSGMQGTEPLSAVEYVDFVGSWLHLRDQAITNVEWLMQRFNVHKQTVNRLLEPWMWVTQIVSGTEWNNFFALRTDAMAEPSMQKIARMMYDAYEASTPKQLGYNQWHLPFIDAKTGEEVTEYLSDFGMEDDQEFYWEMMCKVSAGRCAAVSYLNHDNEERQTVDTVLERYQKLMQGDLKHASPCEHQGTPAVEPSHVSGNFRGWVQFRHMITGNTIEDFKGYK